MGARTKFKVMDTNSRTPSMHTGKMQVILFATDATEIIKQNCETLAPFPAQGWQDDRRKDIQLDSLHGIVPLNSQNIKTSRLFHLKAKRSKASCGAVNWRVGLDRSKGVVSSQQPITLHG